MADPYLGEIRMFAGSFAPVNWTFCNGQLLSIPQYDALFSLLGTTYGGDGRSNFGLPDLRGRIPISQGQAPGSVQNYQLGSKGGIEQINLQMNNMPAHTHGINAYADTNAEGSANGGYFGPNAGATSEVMLYAEPDNVVTMNANVLTTSGESEPLNNMQPYVCINFIIALQGVYPSRG